MKEFSRIRSSQRGSLIVDRHGTILGLDRALESLTGWKAVDVVGRSTDPAADATGDRPEPGFRLFEGEIPSTEGQRSLELTLHCRNGKQLATDAVVHRLEGPGERMLVTILRVMTLLSGEYGNVAAHRDRLTGLQDVESFEARLASAFDSAVRTATPLALILTDIDHLREINNRFGREAGDEVLQTLAGILRVSVSSCNMPAAERTRTSR
jgi:GGDEF domain-containing protein